MLLKVGIDVAWEQNMELYQIFASTFQVPRIDISSSFLAVVSIGVFFLRVPVNFFLLRVPETLCLWITLCPAFYTIFCNSLITCFIIAVKIRK